MKRIFVFTAANPQARRNLEVSIRNPIERDLVFSLFDQADHKRLENVYSTAGGFFAWGATPSEEGRIDRNRSTWNNMSNGDAVLCVYEMTYHFQAYMVDKFDSKQFAQEVWGTKYSDNRPDNSTWQYMYFLTKPVKVNVPLTEVNQWLSRIYYGFTGVGEDKIRQIVTEFGSIESFLNRHILKTEASPAITERPTVEPYLPTKQDFIEAYGAITQLGTRVSIEEVLNQIELNAGNKGLSLKPNWRTITERNILEIWSKQTTNL
jgi:hypothetical protein